MICQAQLRLTFIGPKSPEFSVNRGFYSYEHYRCCQGDGRPSTVATQSILIPPSPVRIPAFKTAEEGSFSRLLVSRYCS